MYKTYTQTLHLAAGLDWQAQSISIFLARQWPRSAGFNSQYGVHGALVIRSARMCRLVTRLVSWSRESIGQTGPGFIGTRLELGDAAGHVGVCFLLQLLGSSSNMGRSKRALRPLDVQPASEFAYVPARCLGKLSGRHGPFVHCV